MIRTDLEKLCIFRGSIFEKNSEISQISCIGQISVLLYHL